MAGAAADFDIPIPCPIRELCRPLSPPKSKTLVTRLSGSFRRHDSGRIRLTRASVSPARIDECHLRLLRFCFRNKPDILAARLTLHRPEWPQERWNEPTEAAAAWESHSGDSSCLECISRVLLALDARHLDESQSARANDARINSRSLSDY